MSSFAMPRAAMPRQLSALLAALILIFPAGLLGLAALQGGLALPVAVWTGIGVTVLLALVLLRFVAGRPFRSPLTALPCVVAAVSLWVAQPDLRDPFGTAALGVLVLAAVALFGGHALNASGAPSLGRACAMAKQLAAHRRWPDDLDACRQIPDVKALRDASRDEAAPALALLSDKRPQVRIAALAALEYRRVWRRGQPDLVLAIAKADPQPEIRAAAALALGGVSQRLLVEELADSLRDPSPLVRQATADALLWECERRWIWVRHAVHEALADPRFAHDGAMSLSIGTFSDQAASDLAAWATEAGSLGLRATQTLALHYSQRLAEKADPRLLAQLTDHVASNRSSAILRIELANLLRNSGHFTPELLDQLLDPANPSPLRLMAVEVLLQLGPNDKAVEVLRQVARQPNREISLHAAVIVQKYLRVDLGLALGLPTPELHTRQAAEVTRRVIEWAEKPVPLPGSAHAPTSSSSHAPTSGSKQESRLPPAAPPPSPPPGRKFAPLEWD